MEDLIKLKRVGKRNELCIVYECDITKDLKELTELNGRFVLVSNMTESIARIEYNSISIGDILLKRKENGRAIFEIKYTSLYMGNFYLIPEFTNSIINKVYKYLKGLQEDKICVMY